MSKETKIAELIERADRLLDTLQSEHKGKSTTINFRRDYLLWYVEARRIIAQVEPDLLFEFDCLYSERNRTTLNESNYCIRDYILLTFPPRDPIIFFQRWFNEFHPTYMRMQAQRQLLEACRLKTEEITNGTS